MNTILRYSLVESHAILRNTDASYQLQHIYFLRFRHTANHGKSSWLKLCPAFPSLQNTTVNGKKNRHCRRREIAGDFNSKLGKKLTYERSIGEHSCGIRNTNGTALPGCLETHSLFACNTALQQATRHKTTWQGQYRDATNGNIVPIYNTIDFVICHLSHKSILTDTRSYAGTLLDSDHRLLIAQLNLSHLYYIWSEIAQPPSAKHARYNTEQLASGSLRTQFRDAVSESLPEVNPNMSASQKWDLLKGTLKSAAETTIGLSEPKNPHCQDMADMSETQGKLRLQINNTRNPAVNRKLNSSATRFCTPSVVGRVTMHQ